MTAGVLNQAESRQVLDDISDREPEPLDDLSDEADATSETLAISDAVGAAPDATGKGARSPAVAVGNRLQQLVNTLTKQLDTATKCRWANQRNGRWLD